MTLRAIHKTPIRGQHSSSELNLIGDLAESIVARADVASVMQRLADELVRRFGFKVALVARFAPSKGGYCVPGLAPRTKLLGIITRMLGIKLRTFVFPHRPDKSDVLRGPAKGKTWMGNDVSEIFKPPQVSETFEGSTKTRWNSFHGCRGFEGVISRHA